jgi:hypothetical protein
MRIAQETRRKERVVSGSRTPLAEETEGKIQKITRVKGDPTIRVADVFVTSVEMSRTLSVPINQR